MSNEQQNNEDIDIMGTEVFDEDTKAQEIIEQIQAEDGIRDFCLSRGLGDVYKRQEEQFQLQLLKKIGQI